MAINRLVPAPRLGRETLDNYAVHLTVPTDLTVLTSGVSQDDSRFVADGIRSFGVILGRGFEVAGMVSGDTAISALYSDDIEECARLILETAADVIAFYQELHGFYPHRSLVILPGDQDPMGGYPLASGIVVINEQAKLAEQPLTRWQFITAHEIGHQVWMDYVLEAPRAGWLMIGLGVYADRAYMLSRGCPGRKLIMRAGLEAHGFALWHRLYWQLG